MPKKSKSEGSVYYNKSRNRFTVQYYENDIKTGKRKRKTKDFKTEEEGKKYFPVEKLQRHLEDVAMPTHCRKKLEACLKEYRQTKQLTVWNDKKRLAALLTDILGVKDDIDHASHDQQIHGDFHLSDPLEDLLKRDLEKGTKGKAQDNVQAIQPEPVHRSSIFNPLPVTVKNALAAGVRYLPKTLQLAFCDGAACFLLVMCFRYFTGIVIVPFLLAPSFLAYYHAWVLKDILGLTPGKKDLPVEDPE